MYDAAPAAQPVQGSRPGPRTVCTSRSTVRAFSHASAGHVPNWWKCRARPLLSVSGTSAHKARTPFTSCTPGLSGNVASDIQSLFRARQAIWHCESLPVDLTPRILSPTFTRAHPHIHLRLTWAGLLPSRSFTLPTNKLSSCPPQRDIAKSRQEANLRNATHCLPMIQHSSESRSIHNSVHEPGSLTWPVLDRTGVRRVWFQSLPEVSLKQHSMQSNASHTIKTRPTIDASGA